MEKQKVISAEERVMLSKDEPARKVRVLAPDAAPVPPKQRVFGADGEPTSMWGGIASIVSSVSNGVVGSIAAANNKSTTTTLNTNTKTEHINKYLMWGGIGVAAVLVVGVVLVLVLKKKDAE